MLELELQGLDGEHNTVHVGGQLLAELMDSLIIILFDGINGMLIRFDFLLSWVLGLFGVLGDATNHILAVFLFQATPLHHCSQRTPSACHPGF